MRILWTLLGCGITAISLIFVLAAASDLLEKNDDTGTGVLIGLLVFFLLTASAGIYLVQIGRRGSREKKERTVLEIAATKGGRVTPAEIAMETALHAEEAQAILDNLCSQGSAEVQVTDSGGLVYVFHGLLSDDEKTTSKDPLNR